MLIQPIHNHKDAISYPVIHQTIITEISGSRTPDSTVSALLTALKDCDIFSSKMKPSRIGLFLGTTLSNFYIRDDNFQKFSLHGLRVMNPANAPKGLISYIGGQLAIKLNIKGMQSTVSSSSSQGLDALSQGMYYLARNQENFAIVIELKEQIEGDFECSIRAGSILILKNASESRDSGVSVSLLGLESFFERKNNNKGLIKALAKIIKSYDINLKNIDSIILSGVHSNQESNSAKEVIDSVKGLSQIPEIKLSGNDQLGNSGLFLLSIIAKNGTFNNNKDKSSSVVLFLHLGQDSNSSCLLLSLKKEVR